MKKNLSKRFWEVDSLRGIAILMMVIYHLMFDIKFSYGMYKLEINEGFWAIFGKSTAILFLLLVGVSLTLSNSRVNLSARQRLTRDDNLKFFKKYLKRGLKIFSWGLIVTFITWLYYPMGYVRFGILHLIGVSIILAFPLLRFKWLNLFLGVSVILVGMYLGETEWGFPWLLWVGFVPDTLIYTLDYFPLLPWFGVILIGMYLGKLLYPNYQRSFSISNLSDSFIIKTLSYLGKHSLFIYLIHQPVIIFILAIIVNVSKE